MTEWRCVQRSGGTIKRQGSGVEDAPSRAQRRIVSEAVEEQPSPPPPSLLPRITSSPFLLHSHSFSFFCRLIHR